MLASIIFGGAMPVPGFLDAAHCRGASVGIVCVPNLSDAQRPLMAVHTEFAFAFPHDAKHEPIASFWIYRDSKALAAIRQTQQFTLSLLRVARYQWALDIFAGQHDPIQMIGSTNPPSLVHSDAVFECAFLGDREVGDPTTSIYNLMLAQITNVTFGEEPDPLINHHRNYWEIARPFLAEVRDSRRGNFRI